MVRTENHKDERTGQKVSQENELKVWEFQVRKRYRSRIFNKIAKAFIRFHMFSTGRLATPVHTIVDLLNDSVFCVADYALEIWGLNLVYYF